MPNAIRTKIIRLVYAFLVIPYYNMELFQKFKLSIHAGKENMANSDLSSSPIPPNPTMFQCNQIQQFKLPIEYLDPSNTFSLSEVVSSDLELVSQSPMDERQCMYDYMFQPTHIFGKLLIPNWNKSYTTNTTYLNDTQCIIKNMNKFNETRKSTSPVNCERIFEVWDCIKQDASFTERYGYLEWDMLKQFNRSPRFLQLLSVMNIMSPLMSLLLPVIFIIFPFILLKIQGVPVSFSSYIEVLKNIAKHHFIGKTLLNMQSFSWDKIIYFMITLGLYGLQIYQNANSCIRYYRNMNKITNIIIDTRSFVEHSIDSMENFLAISENCHTYNEFCHDIRIQHGRLKQLHTDLIHITPFTNSTKSLLNNGELLKHFYQLYENPDYEECIRFSMGFEGYINNLTGVYNNISAGNVSFATFDAKKECDFKQQYYPPLMNETSIKNDCSMKNNIIISAPNKAGKTTMLKTTTINIIFSQQVGCGFYGSADINPYTHIHSYLNIPDTSERDSLFQAESRRCKEIIDIINENNDTNQYRHFCIFDELYSGTNPEEASQAGKAFLSYLSKYKNVRYMLTTHYLKICKHFKNSSSVCNYKMLVDVLPDSSFNYKYKMKKGISKIKGGIRVLKDMDYPEEILASLE